MKNGGKMGRAPGSFSLPLTVTSISAASSQSIYMEKEAGREGEREIDEERTIE